MTDPTGLPSALGIEAVEWFAEGSENLTVRVTGRWRRRRPTWSGQPLLVIEAEGTRHRFQAMPEPPSVTGAPPGTWRMSFSVPALLAPYLSGRAWLRLGAVLLPLPIDVEPEESPGTLGPAERAGTAAASEPPAEPEPAEPSAPDSEHRPASSTIAERQLRSTELALEAARRRAAGAEDAAAELGARIEQLERELGQARGEPARLHALVDERERRLRFAEQRAYAERALREELAEELAEGARELSDAAGVLEELAAVQERVLELEAELEDLRRRGDEAEQVVAAARVARERAERKAAELIAAGEGEGLRGGPIAPATRLREELALARRLAPAPSAGATRLPMPGEKPPGLELERQMLSARSAEANGSVAPLRRELEARIVAETHARGLLAAVQARLDAKEAAEPQLSSTLSKLREELGQLRELAERESRARREAQLHVTRLERELEDHAERDLRAYEAIDLLRAELEAVRLACAGGRLGERGAAPIDPQRLSAALSRLRETTPEQQDGEAEPVRSDAAAAAPDAAVKPWLGPVFRALTDRDPAAAGRLVVGLLPAQRLVHPHPLAFDLVLEGLGCLQVTADPDSVTVQLSSSRRQPAQTQFQLLGDLPSLARLLVAGRIRRRIGRRVAHVQGDRRALGALISLVRAPISLRELYAVGVRLEPLLALSVVSLMVDPAWTRGHRFTIAHHERGGPSAGTYLQVRDGEPLSVTATTPLGPVASTFVCPAESLLPLLDGAAPAAVAIHGERAPLTQVQVWVKRAQSG